MLKERQLKHVEQNVMGINYKTWKEQEMGLNQDGRQLHVAIEYSCSFDGCRGADDYC